MNTEFSVIPKAETKPAVTSTAALRPHPAGTTLHCVACEKPQAHWRIRHPRYGGEEVNICALCFLYTSGWLVKERVRRVEMVANAIAHKKGKKLEFLLGAHGDRVWPPQLVNVSEADNVLGAITLHDRVEASKASLDFLKNALGGKS